MKYHDWLLSFLICELHMPTKEIRRQEAGSNAHTYQKETEDDTSYEQPLSDIKRDVETAIFILTVVEDLI